MRNPKHKIHIHLTTLCGFLFVASCLSAASDGASSINVVGSQIIVDGNKFQARGVGYSPVPPGTDVSQPPYGDLFTSGYSSIWSRDLALLRDMNASLIRVWSYDFINDHSAFLDALWNDGVRPIRILLPFSMSVKIYPDITTPSAKSSILTDFKSFLNRNRNHRAIFGYMIGNELNKIYGESLPALFSLVNDMSALRDRLGISLPITLPLAADSTWEPILSEFYVASSIDFWSVQVYDYQRLQQIVNNFENMAPARPLMITEYGVDVFGFSKTNGSFIPSPNTTSQASTLLAFHDFIAMSNKTVVGGLVFEWVDEWWKGINYAASSVTANSCPNAQPDYHSYCGVIQNNSFIHEEWLGLFSQDDPGSGSFMIANEEYCISARPAYFALRSRWNNQLMSNASTEILRRCATVGLQNGVWYILAPFIVLSILLLLWVLCTQPWLDDISVPDTALDVPVKHAASSAYKSMCLEETRTMVEEKVRNAIESLSLEESFEMIRLRISHLIVNKMLSSVDLLLCAKYLKVEGQPDDDQEPNNERLGELRAKLYSKSLEEVYYSYHTKLMPCFCIFEQFNLKVQI